MLGNWSSKGAWCHTQRQPKWPVGICCPEAQYGLFLQSTVEMEHCIRASPHRTESSGAGSNFPLFVNLSVNQKLGMYLWSLLFLSEIIGITVHSSVPTYLLRKTGRISLIGLSQTQFVTNNFSLAWYIEKGSGQDRTCSATVLVVSLLLER